MALTSYHCIMHPRAKSSFNVWKRKRDEKTEGKIRKRGNLLDFFEDRFLSFLKTAGIIVH